MFQVHLNELILFGEVGDGFLKLVRFSLLASHFIKGLYKAWIIYSIIETFSARDIGGHFYYLKVELKFLH